MHIPANEPIMLKGIIALMEDFAPIELAEPWDNVGLMTGRYNKHVRKIMLALDITKEVVEQAINGKVDLIITHHPLIFKPFKALNDAQWQQELLLTLAENQIAVYSAHTNLDAVSGGVNDNLAKALEIDDYDILDEESHIGRIGMVTPTSIEQFASLVKKKLAADYVIVGNAGKGVHKVAVCGGAGADFIEKALSKGADTFVTGDIKYHDAQRAVFNGLNIIDAGHQATERLVLENLADRLSLRFTELNWNIAVFMAKEKLLLKHI